MNATIIWKKILKKIAYLAEHHIVLGLILALSIALSVIAIFLSLMIILQP